ncbi:MAG: thiamine pyrophosphate-dependent enzyme [Gammaproteobacteria bacterium]
MNTTEQSLQSTATIHPIDSLLRADRFPHMLCPGCGIGTVIHGYAHAIAASGIDQDQHVCVSGIGCSGRAAGYVNVDSYHATHGRALPFALGIAVHNPELNVTVISGDGDLTAIGGNHLIHAARRNVNLNVICINNFNYGMTGGQVGPTTPIGAKGSTAPLGAVEQPFNLPYLAKATGAIFVARWTILHVREFQEAVLRSMNKVGFCFIEVLAPCPTSFGKSNKIGDGLHEVEIYRERCQIENGAENLEELDIDLIDDTRSITVGNFVDVDRKAFMA